MYPNEYILKCRRSLTACGLCGGCCCELDAAMLRARIVQMSDTLPDLAMDVLRRARRQGLAHVVLTRLADSMCERAAECARALKASSR